MLNWLYDFNEMTRTAIVGAIIVGFIILTLGVVVTIKPRIKKENFKYFYAFSAGFMIVIAILGLYHAARRNLVKQFGSSITSEITGINILYSILVFIASVMVACVILWGVKQIVNPKNNKKVVTAEKHKWVGLAMIFAHRVPASIVIGILSIKPAGQGALLLVIMIHIIPEVLILYYRQVDIGYSPKKAASISLVIKLAFYMMIIIGAGIAMAIESLHWLQASLLVIAGTTMTFGVISELTPEFIGFMNPHHNNPVCGEENDGEVVLESIDHHHEIIKVSSSVKKIMLRVSLWLIIGLATAAIILIFHK